MSEREERQFISLARLESRDKLLALKRQLISEVYQNSLCAIKDISKKDYETVVEKILKLVGPLPAKVKVIYPKSREKQAEEALKKARGNLKLKTEFEVAKETFDGVGGFILDARDMRIDGTFEYYLEGLKEEIEPKVIEVLFGGAK